ncbi:D-3-phosphoglycerate dehydrogenase [Stella humosa]|uniref:D-3-phosphoglycerate dehydrogenase n=1 Tax=Stella humosa TaxID=94 RepID=A0A3N1LN45_9PROT|nr:phosphoglycerate dehydrogenase [Stella humosa]ROP90635.1 D-3-phosphoglycerate dehydrogenase [Stella humosa]BBK29467.1 D-3-phosphoglycerate dehydrogenase [Stella humosa]
MPKVLIADSLSPRAVEIFRQRGIEVDVNTGLKPAELRAIVADYDGVAVRSATKITREVLAVADRLKVVGRAGIGIDNIDVGAATARGVVVMNTPFGNSITTAEHAIALMLALARQIPAADRSTQAGRWEKNRFMGVEVTAKTLGVVGCGNIGSIVADRALGLRMKVVAYDPFLSEDRARVLGVEKVDLKTLFARADFITLHTPLTEATRNIIDATSIHRMRRGVQIINCARGGLIDEEALLAGLESGQVAGAAIDVFAVEPATASPLFGRDDVIVTPHLGASTGEAQENVALQVAEQMADFLLTGAVVNAINMPSVSAEEAATLRPYMALGQLLGSFAGQLTEEPIQSVEISFEGDAAGINTKPVTAAMLTGLLAPLLETVNMVSAPVIARERNMQVTEVTGAHTPDYQTLVRVSVTCNGRARTVAGSLFSGTRPRVVEVQGMVFEAELDGPMLFVRNRDQPGFIGALGRALGDAGVNIASFHLGRAAPGEDAICLVQVDQPIGEALLATVRSLPHVVQAKTIRF